MHVKFIQVPPTKHKGNFNTSSGCSKLAHKGDGTYDIFMLLVGQQGKANPKHQAAKMTALWHLFVDLQYVTCFVSHI